MLTLNYHTLPVPKFVEEHKIKSSLKGKGLVVEFVGPTGSGKTTNCQYFFNSLKEEGIQGYTFSDVKKYFQSRNLFDRLTIITSALVANINNIVSYSAQLFRLKIYSFDSIYRYMKLVVFNRILQSFIKTQKPDVVLLDQWIIQGLWSATIFKLDSYDHLPDKLVNFFFQSDMVLYFDVDAATAAKRIESRDGGDSRFDKMDAQSRLDGLKKFDGYLYQLYKLSSCERKFILSTKESPDKNAGLFLYELKHSMILN